jgi:hypothetical protein
MFRALNILAAIVALAVSAAPASASMLGQTQDLPAVSAAPASAGTSITKNVLYNGHAGLITNGTADDNMRYACDVPGFMDYTDDSCMAKPKAGGSKAGRNQVLHETAKAKAPRGAASLTGGIPDGTSNTIGIAPTNVKPKPLSLNTFGGNDTL